MEEITRNFVDFANPDIESIAIIRGRVLQALQQYLLERDFKQLMPILMSPITDPLNHAVYPAEIQYEERRLKLTASMIFHKQLALTAKGHEKIFIVAPNIRLEKAEIKDSENHLLEFSQFDFEIRDGDMHQVMALIEGLIKHVFSEVSQHCATELAQLGRQLPHFATAFPIYSSDALRAEHGDDFEKIMSAQAHTPFFVTNYRREFYDRETPGKRGTYNNYDLIYPDGYGEALSGAEREFEYEQIVYRMNELSMDLEPFANYLEVARRGLLHPSAGGGLGIERLLKFICGKRRIRDVALFDRTVGTSFLF
ncbi:asparagine synthetase A [Pseudomonas sp. GM80]|jgi:asparaginyl-tRNA synthetase|uniref:asparagine synthetase A n=1 Tax=Pseudomonas sp. GM80 TaxID=1144339 RepID=UPI00026FC864|nr:asparagine synthetase A [Pseudomonas sp. GM80]EJN33001.1 aspartyl/asparaginyl-tRNA synthetase [Pseudomonas sp. GM80]